MAIKGVVQDITERRIIEEQLKASEETFSKAFHCAPALMTISTLEEGRYLEVNDAFIDATGYQRKYAVGKTSVELGVIDAKDRNQLKKILNIQGAVKEAELHFKRADRSVMHCPIFRGTD